MTTEQSSDSVQSISEESVDPQAELKDLTDGDLLTQLQESNDGLPRELLREIQSRGEAMVPGLIEVLRADFELAINNEPIKSSGSFFAFALLGAIGDHRALPVIVEAIRLPEDAGDRLLGDALNDTLQRSFVNLIGDDIDLLDQLVDETDLGVYRRWTLAGCYPRLVVQDRLSRELAVDRLTVLIEKEAKRESCESDLVAGFCIEVSGLALESSLPVIRKVYETGAADPAITTLADLEEDIAQGDEHFNQLFKEVPAANFDVADYFANWAAFNETEIEEDDEFLEDYPSLEDEFMQMMGITDGLNSDTAVELPDDFLDEGGIFDEETPTRSEPSTTIRNQGASAGRNDPCPCGSGKKRKKCCR